MRDSVKEFVKIAASTIPMPESIYEFGSYLVEGQEEIANLRPIFPGKEYVGCDMREGPGVDKVLNLHDIDLPSESVGTVLCLDTLEHVEYPHKALEEIHRILRPGGVVIMSSVMLCPIHDHPSDYWRFTPSAFESLLRDFPSIHVDFAGDDLFPHTVVGVGYKGQANELEPFKAQMNYWRFYWSNQVGQPWIYRTWKSIIELFLPPVCLTLYRHIKWFVRKDRR